MIWTTSIWSPRISECYYSSVYINLASKYCGKNKCTYLVALRLIPVFISVNVEEFNAPQAGPTANVSGEVVLIKTGKSGVALMACVASRPSMKAVLKNAITNNILVGDAWAKCFYILSYRVHMFFDAHLPADYDASAQLAVRDRARASESGAFRPQVQ